MKRLLSTRSTTSQPTGREPLPIAMLRRSAIALGILGAASSFNPSHASGPKPIIRIEEDWIVTLDAPDGESFTPQFHTVMSPVSHIDGNYFQTTWNYRGEYWFAPGGLQLQMWENDDAPLKKTYRSDPISAEAETIKWTQVLAVGNEGLKFQIINGQSNAWGSFGGESMKVVWSGSPYSHLGGYSAGVSAEESWISYGSNRVELMQITQIRYYNEDGLVSANSSPITVFEWVD